MCADRATPSVERLVVERLRSAGSVFAEDEAAVLVGTAGSPAELSRMVEQRLTGVPLEVVVGWVSFRGLRLSVSPGVFVPRRRTELLVDVVVSRSGRPGPSSVVVELCCGVAPVASALAAELPDLEVHAADLDPVAAACAQANLGARGQAHTGDLYDALPDRLRGGIDVLVSNAPYVPSGQVALMPPEARDHEPRLALDGGPDGLDVQRRIVADASAWLAPGGYVVIETSRPQATGTVAACTGAGLAASVVADDRLDATVVVATRSVDSSG